MNVVNQRLRQARKDRGWTQSELASRLGVSWKTVNYWENGSKRPQPFNLRRLCAEFGLSAHDLGYDDGPTGGTNGPSPPKPPGAMSTPGTPIAQDGETPYILPERRAHFIGRTRELDILLAEFATSSSLSMAVAIVGISGVGKSELAKEALHRLYATPHRFTQGIVSYPCASLRGLAGLLDVYTLVAESWKVDLSGVAQYADRPELMAVCYESELRGRLRFGNRALALFDDIQPDFPLDRLLTLCSATGLSVLCTCVPVPRSRQLTKQIDLQPLATSEAMRLFAQCYRVFGRPWSRKSDAAATRTLVQRLGCLPMEIHLAAQVGDRRGLTPERLAREVDGPAALRHLRDPTKAGSSLHDLLDRLLSALPPQTQLAFAALGLCEAQVIPADVAGALMQCVVQLSLDHHPISPPQALLDGVALSSLLSRAWDDAADEPIVTLHSLVHTFARDRWSALPSATRRAAVGRLASLVAEYVANRRADDIALTMRKPLILGALRQGLHEGIAGEEITGLAQTIRRHLELSGDWTSLRALLVTRQRSARRAGRLAEEGETFAALGMLAYYQGHRTEVLRFQSHALALAERCGDDTVAMDALEGLGTLALIEDRVDDSERYYTRWLELATRQADTPRTARALVALGDVMTRRWRVPEALDFYRRALERAEEAGDRKTSGYVHMALGHQAFYRCDGLDEASAHYHAAFAIALEMRNRLREAYALRGLGYVATRRERFDEALEYFRQSARIAHEIGNQPGEADALRRMGDVLSRLGRHIEGERVLQHCLRMCRRLRIGTCENHTLRLLGDLELRQGQIELAQRYYEASLVVAKRIGDAVNIGEALMGLGDVAAARSDLPTAREYYEQALARFEPVGYFEAERARARLRRL